MFCFAVCVSDDAGSNAAGNICFASRDSVSDPADSLCLPYSAGDTICVETPAIWARGTNRNSGEYCEVRGANNFDFFICVLGKAGWLDCSKTSAIDIANSDHLAMLTSFGVPEEQSESFRFASESCSAADLQCSVGDVIQIEGPSHFARAFNRSTGTDYFALCLPV